jgi:hypothetical protein
MAKGLPKSYIKKYGISKKAWAEYRNDQKKSKVKASPKTKTKKSGKRTYMARKQKTRRKRSFTLPLGLIAPTIGLVLRRNPSGSSLLERVTSGDWKGLGYDLQEMVGIEGTSGKFRLDYLFNTIAPFIAGGLVHKFVGGAPLNINRKLANAGIPILRI